MRACQHALAEHQPARVKMTALQVLRAIANQSTIRLNMCMAAAAAATAAAGLLLSDLGPNATYASVIHADANTTPPPTSRLAGDLASAPLLQAANSSQAQLAERADQCLEPTDEHLYVRLSTFWYCFLAAITTAGLIVSLVSNMIIIYLFTGTPSLRKNPSNIVGVNLSLSDMLYCIQWPSVIYCSVTQSTWLLEINYVCQTFGFITLATASASVLTVLAMSVERAIVISCPIHPARIRGRGGAFGMRYAWLVVLLIWLVSLASAVPPLFGTFNRFTLDPSKTSCTIDYLSSNPNYKLYTLFLSVSYWLVPALVISICYALIVHAFGRSSASLELALGSNSGAAKASGRRVSTCDGHLEQTSRRPALTRFSSSSKESVELELKGVARTESAKPRKFGTSFRSSFHHGRGAASRASIQIRLAKMSLYLIVLWLVSWTPIVSLGMINSIVKCHHRASPLAVFLANSMTKLGPAFDVLIYGVSHPRIKKKFKLIIKWLFTFGRSGRMAVITSARMSASSTRTFVPARAANTDY